MTTISARLEAALARHTGKPAKVHHLQRLTGGANRTTMSFEAADARDTGAPHRQLIIQFGTPSEIRSREARRK